MQTIRNNMSNRAASQYTSYNYNSMCRFNGILLGAGATGLFKMCCGDDDDGTNIDAHFIPATTHFGVLNGKSLREGYFGFRADGELELTVTGDETTAIGPYTITPINSNVQRRRVSIGQGLQFSYASFKVNNVNGSDFKVDTVDLFVETNSYEGK